MIPTSRSRSSLREEWIQRFIAYTGLVTWFGPTSVVRAWAEASATLAEGAYLLFVALVRRLTVMAASGDYATQVCAERGVERLEASAAKLLVVFRPETAVVASIALGPPDVLTVDDASPFSPGDSIRIRSEDGATTEILTIAAIVGNDIELSSPLVETYAPGSEEVLILARVAVPAGTRVTTTTGVVFVTIEGLYTSDANAALNGESTFVGLADKAWAECTTLGAAGVVDPLSVTGLETPIAGVREVSNPERGTGGDDAESDFALKHRTIHAPTLANQETAAWLEGLCTAGNASVLRAIKVESVTYGQMDGKVLTRSGGGLSAAALTALEAYCEQRVRSNMAVSLTNVRLTAVEIEARITLAPDTTLQEVGRRISASAAAFLDYRKWDFGTDVENADLLSLVNGASGVASLETSSFLPAAAVSVDDDSLPVLLRVSLEDIATGDTWNADLAVSF